VGDDLFLDASYAIALAADSDQLHQRAVQLAIDIEQSSRRLVTTGAVLIEIGNSLAKLRYRAAAVALLSSVSSDPTVEVVPLTDDLFRLAFELFSTRDDKEWGLTDCASFIVMRSRGLTEALTADGHYEQAGFRALLREL
jgi:predicted nucleic acid-binding protein